MNAVRPLDAYAQQLQASISIYTADDWADLVAACRAAVVQRRRGTSVDDPYHIQQLTAVLARLRSSAPFHGDPTVSQSYGHIPGWLQDRFRAACGPSFSRKLLELMRHRRGAARGGAAPAPPPPPA